MNLLRAASTISLFTLASRITGLVRDVLVASLFGASAWMDAFNVAFRIPNLLRRLFAEGAFSQAFVPVLARTRAAEGDDATRSLIDAVATVLFWALSRPAPSASSPRRSIVWLMASGLERLDGAVLMTRFMFPYIGFMSLVALSAGVLNTWRRFAVPAATPVLLNVAMIGAAWGLSPRFAAWGIEPIYALAAGVMLGGVLQLAAQIPALLRVGGLPRIGLAPAAIAAAWRHPGVARILMQMAPALVGVSVAQFSMLINTQIASHQGVGAVSWLFYADRLMEFPTGLLGVALGVVLMPQLAAAQGRADAAGYSALLDWGLRLVLLLALPCAAALLVFPTPLVAVLFQRGAFTAHDVAQTVPALMGYGVGLIGSDRREDPRARVLCPPGHPHAGEDRDRGAGADAAAEPAAGAVPRACRPGAVDRLRCADQRRLALRRLATRRRVRALAGMGRLSPRASSVRLRFLRRCSPGVRAGSTGSACTTSRGCASAGWRRSWSAPRCSTFRRSWRWASG